MRDILRRDTARIYRYARGNVHRRSVPQIFHTRYRSYVEQYHTAQCDGVSHGLTPRSSRMPRGHSDRACRDIPQTRI